MPKITSHPNAAELFIDFLGSPEGLLRYADAKNSPVLDPEVDKRAKAIIQLKELGLDWTSIPTKFGGAEAMKKATSWWTSALGLKRGRT